MRFALPLALAMIAVTAAPTLAAPICSGTYALSTKRYTEAEINEYNMELLRGQGVDATRVEMWGGCIRAWVRQNGREEMQFFEPMNLRRVE